MITGEVCSARTACLNGAELADFSRMVAAYSSPVVVWEMKVGVNDRLLPVVEAASSNLQKQSNSPAYFCRVLRHGLINSDQFFPWCLVVIRDS